MWSNAWLDCRVESGRQEMSWNQYRTKPVLKRAYQFVSSEPQPYDSHIYQAVKGGNHYINTLEGRMLVSEGDWIIEGLEGEQYPCRPGIFKKTFCTDRNNQTAQVPVSGAIYRSWLFRSPISSSPWAGTVFLGEYCHPDPVHHWSGGTAQ